MILELSDEERDALQQHLTDVIYHGALSEVYEATYGVDRTTLFEILARIENDYQPRKEHR